MTLYYDLEITKGAQTREV